jgi:hypothetical protein
LGFRFWLCFRCGGIKQALEHIMKMPAARLYQCKTSGKCHLADSGGVSLPDGRGSVGIVRALALVWALSAATVSGAEPGVEQLAKEVGGQGWILFSAKTAKGDYDLFLARPDGSNGRNLTQTAGFNEYGGRFSPDGKRMLYRRAAAGGPVSHDLWGAMGTLVLANADGSHAEAQGGDGEYPWASWSPDGKQIACLYKREGKLRILDLATKRLVQERPRAGIFQQCFWSPDGKRVCGTANLQGQDWKILSLELETGKATLVSRNLSCTPDWFQKDPNRVAYSCRVPGVENDYGWTMLVQGAADGKERRLIYGERGKHIYFGCTSPDDRYVIFSAPTDDGGVDAEMALVRLADTPIVAPASYQSLQALYPEAKHGPVLHLGRAGFEPHWTYAPLEGRK